jgi:hypothetical protein
MLSIIISHLPIWLRSSLGLCIIQRGLVYVVFYIRCQDCRLSMVNVHSIPVQPFTI